MPKTLWLVFILLLSFMTVAQAQTAPPGGAESGAQTQPAEAAARSDPPSDTTLAASARGGAAAPSQASTQWWERTDWLLVVPTWIIALVGLSLALYTTRLWKATSTLAQDGRDISRKELRAYVALDEIFFSDASDAAAATHKLRIRNYGQTPASGMSIWCERASHLPQEGVKPFYDSPVVDGQLLHPVQAFTVGLASAPLYRIGKTGFFTYGRIVYHDIYGQWWVTKFCYRYEGEGTFVPHGDYNNEEGPFEKAPA
jgi:hypothetical protein